jgi:TatD DNase family protein
VTQMVVTGSTLASSAQAVQLARAYPGILFATAGVHPHHASELDAESLPILEALARQPEVVAVGECGLDFFRNFSPHDAQRAAFGQQLDLAARVGKPLFLHQRDAHDDFAAMLAGRGQLRGVAHCFTGDAPQLQHYLGIGLAIGITGWICDERRGAHLLPLMREIPAARLLLETDGPYLLPRNLTPKPSSRRNEPAYLLQVADTVARARGESVRSVARSSTMAARELFRLAPPV